MIEETLHIPSAGGTALGTEPAVKADVLVLHHDPSGLRQRVRYVKVLIQFVGRHAQLRAKGRLLIVGQEVDAFRGADIDTGVALDTAHLAEHRLHVAVQAALGLAQRQLLVVAELDLERVGEAVCGVGREDDGAEPGSRAAARGGGCDARLADPSNADQCREPLVLDDADLGRPAPGAWRRRSLA